MWSFLLTSVAFMLQFPLRKVLCGVLATSPLKIFPDVMFEGELDACLRTVSHTISLSMRPLDRTTYILILERSLWSRQELVGDKQ